MTTIDQNHLTEIRRLLTLARGLERRTRPQRLTTASTRPGTHPRPATQGATHHMLQSIPADRLERLRTRDPFVAKHIEELASHTDLHRAPAPVAPGTTRTSPTNSPEKD